MIAKRVYSEPEDVDERLAGLGLDAGLLIESVQRGHAAFANCTPNHPLQFGGIAAWAETVSALRERLMVEGWTRSNESNLPFTVNPSGTVAITVSTGDKYTGNKGLAPCTKSSKGPRTKRAVRENNDQYRLFGDVCLTPETIATLDSRETWILLIHRDVSGLEVRCELSRPINMNEDGKVDGWSERIILAPITFGGDVLEVPDDKVPQTPNIAINITRRA